MAHAGLMSKFKFSDRQSTAILEMRLQKLASLERQKIEDELKEIYANEEKNNDYDDNPFPHYIQIDFDKFNKNESNIGNQLEIKQISSDNSEIERNK
jgi:DNA gyrase/topoisomerase IV subunit A